MEKHHMELLWFKRKVCGISLIRGEGINIAVIDSGCDVDHESLKDNIVAVRNFTDEDNKNPNIVIDRVGHGTHVCGNYCSKWK